MTGARSAAVAAPCRSIAAVAQSSVHRVLARAGRPLDPVARATLQQGFGHDLGAIRIHADDEAAASARSVGAAAYAVGRHLVFGRPPVGRLLAHEVAHALQQRDAWGSSPAELPLAPRPGAEAEADRAAARIGAGVPATPLSRSGPWLDRQPETWYRGQGAGVAPAQPGAWLHDFGDGLYLTDRADVARQYATLRASEGQTTGEVLTGTFERRLLGNVLDLTRDPRWQAFLRSRPTGAQTVEELIHLSNENYSHFFEGFLHQNGIDLSTYDAVIGPELVRGGNQICIRNPAIAAQVRALLRPVPTGAGGGGSEAEGGGGSGPVELPVRSEYSVRSSVRQSDGSVVTEIDVHFTEGLDELNRTVAARGGRSLPERVVIRVTQTPEGAISGVEGLAGESAGLADALAQQALATVPRSALAGEVGAAGGAAGAVSPWVRGAGWVGIGLFVIVTGYELATSPVEQWPRIGATAVGGLAGGALTSYLVCNALLGIETVGWSLLGCALVAGVPGGIAGSAIAGAAYDAATATPMERALNALRDAPPAARQLFYLMTASRLPGVPVSAGFVRRFIAAVPANLTMEEVMVLARHLRAAVPGDTQETVLADLLRAIEALPGRAPVRLPPLLDITDVAPGRGVRIDALGGGRIRLLPEVTPPPLGLPPPPAGTLQMRPLVEIQL